MIVGIPSNSSIAARWLDAGCSIIPVKADGSKKAQLRWKRYEAEKPPRELITLWFDILYAPPPSAIGVICGVVSGHLEVLDFDDGSLFAPWFEMVKPIAQQLPIVRTGGGGYHVLYRCSTISPGCKIATDPSREKETLIESRGEGNYVIGIGSPATTHASGHHYHQVAGPELPENIPTITPEERLELWKAARTFDKGDLLRQEIETHRRKIEQAAKPPRPISAESPIWKIFDQQADWHSLLTGAGWSTHDGEHWTRPGKTDSGTSAKLNLSQSGQEVLTIFSSNAGIDLNASHRSLSPSQFITETRFGGDWKASTHWMRGEVAR